MATGLHLVATWLEHWFAADQATPLELPRGAPGRYKTYSGSELEGPCPTCCRSNVCYKTAAGWRLVGVVFAASCHLWDLARRRGSIGATEALTVKLPWDCEFEKSQPRGGF